MKQKNRAQLVAGLIIAAFVIRILQIFLVIDFKTGFYKSNLSALGVGLTVLSVVLSVAAALLAKNTFNTVNNVAVSKTSSVISGVVSGFLFCELLIENFVVQGNAWQVVLMKAVGFLTAAYFALFALSGIFKFKIPDLMHTLPAFYMIIRIICSFINISSLSLIAENIFLLASYCCALLFFVSYAAFNCLEEKVPRTLSFRAVLAFALCFITAVPNVFASIFVKGGYAHIPLYSQAVLLALTFFIGNFIFENCLKKVTE